MYFWCFGFRSELGFLNCDDVCMCVVNKQFELLEFVSESVYVDLQYDEISLRYTAGPVCLSDTCTSEVHPCGQILGLHLMDIRHAQKTVNGVPYVAAGGC